MGYLTKIDQGMYWFKNYLSNRKQKVVVHGKQSDWEHVKDGVPQGSILRPLLFSMYINDIVTDIQFSVKFLADDTVTNL
jgi:hypothetical protein